MMYIIKIIKFYFVFISIFVVFVNTAIAENLIENRTKLLQNYLFSIDNISFLFQQMTNDDSTKGWMIIEKPSKIRIEYEEPEDLVIIGTKKYIILYNAIDDIITNLENEGPWNILTKKHINLSYDKEDKNAHGFVQEIKEIEMNDGIHLFYKIAMKNDENINFAPIVIHMSTNPTQILGWTIYGENKTHIRITDIIEINKKNINKDIFKLTEKDRASGKVWKGPFNRKAIKRLPNYR